MNYEKTNYDIKGLVTSRETLSLSGPADIPFTAQVGGIHARYTPAQRKSTKAKRRQANRARKANR